MQSQSSRRRCFAPAGPRHISASNTLSAPMPGSSGTGAPTTTKQPTPHHHDDCNRTNPPKRLAVFPRRPICQSLSRGNRATDRRIHRHLRLRSPRLTLPVRSHVLATVDAAGLTWRSRTSTTGWKPASRRSSTRSRPLASSSPQPRSKRRPAATGRATRISRLKPHQRDRLLPSHAAG